MEDTKNDKGLNRRDFIKCTAVLGGALLASQMEWTSDLMRRAEAGMLTPGEEYELIKAENTLYTVCLQCNTGCGIKVKLFRKGNSAVALKIDGNAYNPFVAVPHPPFSTKPTELNTVDMAICPKGQGGIQTAYDPYRITKVLKRAGKRGEGKWRTIPFDRTVDMPWPYWPMILRSSTSHEEAGSLMKKDEIREWSINTKAFTGEMCNLFGSYTPGTYWSCLGN